MWRKEVVKSAKAGLALLDGTSKGLRNWSKKSKKAKEAEAMSKEANGAAKVPKDPAKANFEANLVKAKKAAKDAKGAMTAAASQMFAFYANLLPPKIKYAWNKIVVEQTDSNPYVNLQGVSLEGPRECPASYLTIVWSSVCSPCSPSTWQSKKSTTSQIYLRSPSVSTYVSLYVK